MFKPKYFFYLPMILFRPQPKQNGETFLVKSPFSP